MDKKSDIYWKAQLGLFLIPHTSYFRRIISATWIMSCSDIYSQKAIDYK